MSAFNKVSRFSMGLVAVAALAACGGSPLSETELTKAELAKAMKEGVYDVSGKDYYLRLSLPANGEELKVESYLFDEKTSKWTVVVRPPYVIKYIRYYDGQWHDFNFSSDKQKIFFKIEDEKSFTRTSSPDQSYFYFGVYAIKNISGKDPQAGTPLADTQVFPANSTQYALKYQGTNIKENIWAASDDEGGPGKGIIYAADGSRAKSFAQVIERNSLTAANGLRYGGGCAYFEPGNGTSGTVHVRGQDANGKCSGMANTAPNSTITSIDNGTWTIGTRMGQAFMKINLDGEALAAGANGAAASSQAGVGLVIAGDGQVRFAQYTKAYTRKVPADNEPDLYFNKTGADFMLKTYKRPATL